MRNTLSKAFREPTGAAQSSNAWRCTMNTNGRLSMVPNAATSRLQLGELESKSSNYGTQKELQFLRDTRNI